MESFGSDEVTGGHIKVLMEDTAFGDYLASLYVDVKDAKLFFDLLALGNQTNQRTFETEPQLADRCMFGLPAFVRRGYGHLGFPTPARSSLYVPHAVALAEIEDCIHAMHVDFNAFACERDDPVAVKGVSRA